MTVPFSQRLTKPTPQLAALIAATTLSVLVPTIAQAQTGDNTPVAPTSETPGPAIVPLNPLDLRPLVRNSDFSIPGLERTIAQADAEIAAEDYDAAYDTLIAARETSNALAGHYQKLSGQFSGIDNRIYEAHRSRALAAAQLRDAATYRLAIVHQARGQAELAVPLLLQVLASQSPTRELGRDSYNLLYDLGFVTVPYRPELANTDATDTTNTTDTTTPDETIPEAPVIRPLEGGILSSSGLSRLMLDADTAVSLGDNRGAIAKLQEARQLANELSGFYQQLTSSFSGIDNTIYQTHRTNALDTAQVRDEATYQLALLFRASEAPELAVPLLMEVVTSQSPTRDLGKQAYRQLYELGFVDENYPRGQV
ncbi:MAG: hypothetical protein EAZ61_00710 [Oscillatoriales cyanobacterium]|nr:MAG: hypothetical protein EAZ61_00710 [Oscillatoriales cyanobacterium]